jgi:hypothetical protein
MSFDVALKLLDRISTWVGPDSMDIDDGAEQVNRLPELPYLPRGRAYDESALLFVLLQLTLSEASCSRELMDTLWKRNKA